MQENTEIEGTRLTLKGTKESGYKVWAITGEENGDTRREQVKYIGMVKCKDNRWSAVRQRKVIATSKLRRDAVKVLLKLESE